MSRLLEDITRRFRNSKSLGHRRVPPPDLVETEIRHDPREGKQLGAYRILRRLGAGGMGHVYLALDTRLGRHVALKFLPPELLSDQDMLHRLEQEARTASALNHPNILTIYEVVQLEGELFIASEFVDGVTLRQAMQRNTIDPEMAVRVALQIASALQAAHQAGIIHRDLKPANIMVRTDGYVKVIDFGLAKMMVDAGGTRSPGLSRSGSVIGTVDYMSPEQARGEELDARTDLWSLGVVLFEMLSRQRPFTGETESHVIVAILDRPAPTLPNLSTLAPGLGRIVQHALTKDPAKRYQSAHEILTDLEGVGTGSGLRRALPLMTAHSRRRSFGKRATLLFSALILAMAATWWWGLGGKDRILEPDWFRIESVQRVTFNGRTLLSAISPDGKYLAFVVGDTGGMQSLHVKQMDQTSDEVLIPSRKIDYTGLTFSPDSRNIYEVEEEESTLVGKLFVVPVVGERPGVPLIENIDGPVTFSPNGEQFAFVRWEHPPNAHATPLTRSVIEISKLGSGNTREFFASTSLTLMSHLAWSPKGDQIAAAVRDTSAASDQLELNLFGLNGQQIRKRLPGWSAAGQLAWERNGRSLVLNASSKGEGNGRSQLREFAIHRGNSHDLVKDLSGYASVSLTQDRERLAAVRMDPRATLWISAPNDFAHGQSSLSELQDNASLAWMDEGSLLVSSRRTGYPNLAVFRLSDASVSGLTFEASVEQHAVPTPDGASIVYSSNRSGGFHVWRYDRHLNRYAQLTFGSTYDDMPAISPDGKWIVYTLKSSTYPRLFKIPIKGGTPIPLGNFAAADPRISPDGRWVACQIQIEPDHWRVAVIPFDGPVQSPRIIPNASAPFQWSKRGDALASTVTDTSGVSNLWQTPLDGSPPERLTHFEDEKIVAFAFSRKNRLASIRLQHYSDVVLFQRQKP